LKLAKRIYAPLHQSDDGPTIESGNETARVKGRISHLCPVRRRCNELLASFGQVIPDGRRRNNKDSFMPNYASTSLMVFGNPHDIACFRAICFSLNPDHPREERLDFEKIMPSPPTVRALEALPDREWRNAQLLLQRIGIDVSNETVSPRFSRASQL
jgi:hypothetical protein